MTDSEIIQWVDGLIGLIEQDRAVDPHDMDSEYAKLADLKKRLADQQPGTPASPDKAEIVIKDNVIIGDPNHPVGGIKW